MWLSLTGGSKIFRGGGATPKRVTNLLFGIIFLEICMKMKRIGTGVGTPALGPLDPPLVIVTRLLHVPIPMEFVSQQGTFL